MKRPTVYTMRDATGNVLYIGMSENGPQRLASHRRQTEWWDEVATIDVQHCATRGAAFALEQQAIRAVQPPYNKRSVDTCAQRTGGAFPTYDRLKFGGRLAETLTAWRADGLSIDEVMIRLHAEDVPVSRSTVVRWLDIATQANDGPEAA